MGHCLILLCRTLFICCRTHFSAINVSVRITVQYGMHIILTLGYPPLPHKLTLSDQRKKLYNPVCLFAFYPQYQDVISLFGYIAAYYQTSLHPYLEPPYRSPCPYHNASQSLFPLIISISIWGNTCYSFKALDKMTCIIESNFLSEFCYTIFCTIQKFYRLIDSILD